MEIATHTRMTQDDFDLVPRTQATRPPGGGASSGPPPEVDPEPPQRNWGWLITLAVVAFLFFGVGAAIVTLRDRLGGQPTPAATIEIGLGTPTRQPVGLPATLTASTSPTATVALVVTTPTPRQTLTPTPSPSPTAPPTPCALGPASFAVPAYNRALFGCAKDGGQIVWAAWEPFERGSMLWRSDSNRSYFFTLGGQWQIIDASWNGDPPPSRGDPPPDRVQPERGFGWVWGTRDDIFRTLGWATDREKGFCTEVQEFEQGFILQSSSVDSCTADNLYNNAGAGDWRPVYVAAHKSGVWSGALGGSTVVAAAPTRSVTVAARPEANGIFQASRAGALQLDGDLSDWPFEGWNAIATLVEGRGKYKGPEDASGRFQVAWAPDGLVLGVQVFDDEFRPGVSGTEMWQGDALELQVDAQLAQDSTDTNANADDYQIGIGLGSDGRTLQTYRWLPRAIEGILPVSGVGATMGAGYTIEVLIPWNALGIAQAQGGDSFGFNLSISDNDGNKARQESVVSASPARTTYDNPAEWGTLVLLP